ncbi:MAG: hypothetical protein KIT09_08775 [Bryobacteraceae bacterium]|nr:hypothetical protein [Bryobacteraceae bacterium]
MDVSVVHLGGEEAGFDAGEVFHAPGGDGDFVDQGPLVDGGGPEVGAVVGEEGLEFLVGFGEQGGGGGEDAMPGGIRAGALFPGFAVRTGRVYGGSAS